MARKKTSLPAIGAMLRHLRRKRKLTQKQLAQLVGTEQHIISDIERGRYNYTKKMLTRIFAVLEK